MDEKMKKEVNEVLKEIEDLECHAITVCNDPMNGCPGDFAEDFSRRGNALYSKALVLGASEKQIQKAQNKGHDNGYYNSECAFGDFKYRGRLGAFRWWFDGVHDKFFMAIESYKWKRGIKK